LKNKKEKPFTLGDLYQNEYLCGLHFFPICGVYFLIENNEVVYVGQSNDIESRIRNHRYENTKQFSEVVYFRCKQNTLRYHEKKYIKLFLPKYNIADKPIPKNNFWERHGLPVPKCMNL